MALMGRQGLRRMERMEGMPVTSSGVQMGHPVLEDSSPHCPSAVKWEKGVLAEGRNNQAEEPVLLPLRIRVRSAA